MKRPYREGDWFAVPLGDGRFAAGIVTHGTRNAINGSFFGPARETTPALEELAALRPEDAVWSGRFSDRSIVEQRWPVIGHRAGFIRAQWPGGRSKPAARPELVELRLAALGGGGTFQPPRLSVRAVRSPIEPGTFDALDGRAIVGWHEPLAPDDLARVEALVASNSRAAIRLHGDAAAHVNALAEWPSLSRLELESSRLPHATATFPRVVDLRLDGVPANLERTIAAFPAVRTLRIRARGELVDASALHRAHELDRLELRDAIVARADRLADVTSLRRLDVQDASLDAAANLLRMPLRALRLARIASFQSVSGLRDHPTLRTLALDGLLEIDDLRPIATIARLESLDLRGLWQFDIDDLAFVHTMPSLRRLHVDIGGRRKNAEIYRKGAYAAPLPLRAADDPE
ncbi:MAG TPA: Imm26 family immunity protein [Candidatus Acidoferrales bacterium]|jgi:hypothetical protein|nr:Imm26 family immunity protein [Candidatus Acidoferrales bacterium]